MKKEGKKVSKAQSLEYISIFTIVLLISIFAVFQYTSFFDLSPGVPKNSNLAKLQSESIGINKYAFTPELGILEVKNNLQQKVSVNSFKVEDYPCYPLSFDLKIGEDKLIYCNISTPSKKYRYEFTVNYEDDNNLYLRSDSDVTLFGQRASGDFTIPPEYIPIILPDIALFHENITINNVDSCPDISGVWSFNTSQTINESIICFEVVLSPGINLTIDNSQGSDLPINITAINITIPSGSFITSDGNGFGISTGPGYSGKGGSHGNKGGNSGDDYIYGSSLWPITLGSGGSGGEGGSGGGAIAIIGKNIILNGTISSNGNQLENMGSGDDSGAGGSILIYGETIYFSNNFSVTSKGGSGNNGHTWSDAGSGGRVAVYFRNSNFNIGLLDNFNVSGGESYYDGEPGTLFISNLNSNAAWTSYSFRFQGNSSKANETVSFPFFNPANPTYWKFSNLNLLNSKIWFHEENVTLNITNTYTASNIILDDYLVSSNVDIYASSYSTSSVDSTGLGSYTQN